MRLIRSQRFKLNAIVNKLDEHFHSNLCVGFRAALFECFRSWLGEVLGIELEATVDISCAKYEYTGKFWYTIWQSLSFLFFSHILSSRLDVLLCHDDELEGRRVAFILYLVPPWQRSDGGTLDLYSTDGEFPILVHLRMCLSQNHSILFVSFFNFF